MNDPRKTLLQLMADLRQTIDPAVLDRARAASQDQVPYDKVAARAAVKGFLAAKSKLDGGAFQRRLIEALQKEAGQIETVATRTAPAKAAPTPPKPQPQPKPQAQPQSHLKRWFGPAEPKAQSLIQSPKRPTKRP